MKLEVVVVPVADVDRAKAFYQALGWRLDADFAAGRRITKETPMQTSFDSASDLALALRRAAAAHGRHEERTGQPDPDWPDWYAEYMVREQAGEELPT
jgi:catechol 2,3-dioxygenase-like lactoylglutathione lyase family enzyme